MKPTPTMMERRKAGRSAIDGLGAERTSAAAPVIAVGDGRLPSATSIHVMAAVMAARHALGEPPANDA